MRAALNFSRSEKRGILVLIGIMILIYLIPSVINIHNQKEEEIVIIASFIEFEKQLTANIEFEKAKEEKAAVYFNFNYTFFNKFPRLIIFLIRNVINNNIRLKFIVF